MRLDKYLTENGYSSSRVRSAGLIKNGKVTVDGVVVTKTSFIVPEGSSVQISGGEFPYVGRGALKLLCALDSFGISPDALVCADIGASTGGFTDVLIQRNAKRVYAVDSGHGQLDPRLREDDRVVVMEGFNARDLSADDFGELCDLVVCDVSFISQTLLHAPIRSVLKDSGSYIGLVKPQFELSRSEISKGGIVKDVRNRYEAVKRVCSSLEANGFFVDRFCKSPITGGDGNIEYLILARKGKGVSHISLTEIERIVFDENRDPAT